MVEVRRLAALCLALATAPVGLDALAGDAHGWKRAADNQDSNLYMVLGYVEDDPDHDDDRQDDDPDHDDDREDDDPDHDDDREDDDPDHDDDREDDEHEFGKSR